MAKDTATRGGETLEEFAIAKNMVIFSRRFDLDHPELCYGRDPKVLERVAQTFAGRGNQRDAALIRTAIQQLNP